MTIIALRRFAFVGALALGGLGLWSLGHTSADANNTMLADATAVRTIDINAVLEKLNEREAKEAELKSYFMELEAKVQRIQGQLEQAQGDLEILVEGTPAFEEKRNEIIRLRLSIEGEAQLAQALAEERRKLLHKDLFDKIVRATERYATREGVGVVFNDDSQVALPIANMTGNQVQSAIVGRRVIWRSPDVDISDEVARMMNNEFQVGGS